ncbi:betaine--homocysteine S-methyltransferase 1-like isoform X1 [Apostichopus japonicus]|uniref:betaine--homocysteine S-methyltransferase 1-like isoform X1 n=1 Tax=Stichopus japonicus TaxID=307972 RepID=UPI003AB34AA7
MAPKGLLERLHSGEKVVVAEGYLFNFERRGFLQAGPFVPTVVLDHPELVRQLHEEFVRAGSDVVQALTYYANREKLSLIDRETDLEKLNRDALRIAKGVAVKTNTLLAGNICNTNIYDVEDPVNREKVKKMFKEQIDIIVEEGADFIIAETFVIFAEAMIAVEAIKEYGKGITSVVTLAPHLHNTEQGQLLTVDNVEITEAIKKLESAGADVVGLNCASGPDTMLSYMELIKKAGVKAPLACVPVPYRTTPKEHTFMLLTDPVTGEFVFPTNLDCALCTRDDIYKFGRRCDELGIPYIGLCCGNAAAYTRTLCESIGRKPPASKYSPCMEVHCLFGKDERVLKNHSKQSLENIVTRKGKM